MNETDFKAFDTITGEDITDELKLKIKKGEAEYMWVRDVVEEDRIYNMVNIFIIPHYIGDLRYFDRMYDKLRENGINPIYIIKPNKAMLDYLYKNNRKREILYFHKAKYLRKLNMFIEPYLIYSFKKQFKELLDKYNVKLVLQWNDCDRYNDSIDKVCKRNNITTFILQWAPKAPRNFFLEKTRANEHEYIEENSYKKVFYRYFILRFIKMLGYPLYKAFRTYSKVFPAYGAGSTDFIGVFSNFYYDLFVNDEIDKEKIHILGSFDYDDLIKAKDIPKEEIIEKYRLSKADYYIVYFLCPFYTKDLTFMSKEQQMEHTMKLRNTIQDFFKSKGKSSLFILKLHPAEKLEDYSVFFDFEDILVLFEGDNNELISLSDLCITHQTSLLEPIIAMEKPFIDIDMVKFRDHCDMKVLMDTLGITKQCRDWFDLVVNLNLVYENDFRPIDNFKDMGIIRDGKCYERIVNFIKRLIKITELRQK